jgi:hypothetical protein
VNRTQTIYQPSLLVHDIGIVILSVLVALILVRTDILISVLTATQSMEYLGSFIAGVFFTSIFTTAPAMVTLGEIAQANGIAAVAFFGAIGAMVGDLLIFRFVKDRVSPHIAELLRERGVFRRTKKVCTTRLCRWLPLMIGGLILASPLPDELGVGFLGTLKTRVSVFLPLSFAFNFLGIVIIGLIAQSL